MPLKMDSLWDNNPNMNKASPQGSTLPDIRLSDMISSQKYSNHEHMITVFRQCFCQNLKQEYAEMEVNRTYMLRKHQELFLSVCLPAFIQASTFSARIKQTKENWLQS